MKSLLIILCLKFLRSVALEDIYSCDSEIYCQGRLLHTIQTEEIFEDSKSFVDRSLKLTVNETLDAFDIFMEVHKNNPSKEDLANFVEEYFDAKGEFETWMPPDFNPEPKFLKKINNTEVKEFAESLVMLWAQLGMKVRKPVINEPEKHSLIALPNGFIVPGGRFKEIYYWDSYWIIEGLIVCEMLQTVRGMLENFLFLVERYGFVPNGSRVYYLNRSQPPLLSLMFARYFEESKDVKFAIKHFPTLEKELEFWMTNRTVNVTKDETTYIMARYAVESNTPRPESYSEDVTTCKVFFGYDDDLRYCYSQLKSGAESGMDFSSRWIADKTQAFRLSDIEPSNVIPVDLNSYLCKAAAILSDIAEITGNYKKSKKWFKISQDWKKAIKVLFYNSVDGIWYDYDLKGQKQIKEFYPSNFAPLWAGAYDTRFNKTFAKKAADYLQKLHILSYTGGIPTSFNDFGEQWDLPNAWPPLQEIVIMGLYKSDSEDAIELAHKLANNWINANMIGFKTTGEMFEKYHAEKPGQYGSGGEYTIQTGFGWTNGVALRLISIFQIEPVTTSGSVASNQCNSYILGLVFLLFLRLT